MSPGLRCYHRLLSSWRVATVTLATTGAIFPACSLDNRNLELASGGAGSGTTGVSGAAQEVGGDAGGHFAGMAGEAGGAVRSIAEVDGCADLDTDKRPDCVETLLENADFRGDVKHWLADSDATVAWSDENAAGKAPSGSALIASPGVIDENGSGVALRSAQQCVPIDGAKLVLVYANAYVEDGQDEQGRAEVDVAFFDSEDCRGALSTSFSTPQPLDFAVDSWFTLKAGSVSAATTKSAQVKLALLKPFRANSFQARFDNVLLKAETVEP